MNWFKKWEVSPPLFLALSHLTNPPLHYRTLVCSPPQTFRLSRDILTLYPAAPQTFLDKVHAPTCKFVLTLIFATTVLRRTRRTQGASYQLEHFSCKALFGLYRDEGGGGGLYYDYESCWISLIEERNIFLAFLLQTEGFRLASAVH
jgi:hypothetical protein